QHNALALERAFRGLALKTTAPWCETMTPRDFVNGHEPDVVPVLRVFCAGITEANKESHDAASPAVSSLLLLVAATGRRLRGRRHGGRPSRPPPEPQPVRAEQPPPPRGQQLRRPEPQRPPPEPQQRHLPQPPRQPQPPSALRRSRRAARW